MTKILGTSFTVITLFSLYANSPVSATVFFADQFSYADGQLTDTLKNDAPGKNVSGSAWVGHSGTTFNDNVDVIDGKAQLRNSGNEDISRSLGQTMGEGDIWYYGVRATVNFIGEVGDDVNNDFFVHFKDEGNGFRALVFLDDPADEPLQATDGSEFSLGLSASSSQQQARWPFKLTFGDAFNIMASYNYDTGESRLWVDPVDASSNFISDVNGETTEIVALALRQDFITSGATNNNEILIDSVAVGDDFAEVLSSLSTVVPEPSCFQLALVAAISLLSCFRPSR